MLVLLARNTFLNENVKNTTCPKHFDASYILKGEAQGNCTMSWPRFLQTLAATVWLLPAEQQFAFGKRVYRYCAHASADQFPANRLLGSIVVGNCLFHSDDGVWSENVHSPDSYRHRTVRAVILATEMT